MLSCKLTSTRKQSGIDLLICFNLEVIKCISLKRPTVPAEVSAAVSAHQTYAGETEAFSTAHISTSHMRNTGVTLALLLKCRVMCNQR